MYKENIKWADDLARSCDILLGEEVRIFAATLPT